MQNINPNFDGKFNISTDLFAYIDESGEEGFDFSKSSTWFNVSAIILTFGEANEMIEKVKKEMNIKEGGGCSKATFKNIRHNRRKDLLGVLSGHKYLTVHSCFYKPKIDPADRLVTYPSMYFVGIKNMVERLSWIPQQFNKERVHILISNRNSVKSFELKKYLFSTSLKANKNLAYINKIGQVSLSSISSHPKLLLADYSASSMFQCIEKQGKANISEKIYAEIFLQGKIYASNHSKFSGIWRNGIKITPDEEGLLEYKGILEEGSHEF